MIRSCWCCATRPSLIWTPARRSTPRRSSVCVLQWKAGEPESVRQLPYCDIEAATGGFGAENRLAGGGSCTVFQGSLFGLMDVAVKQLHSDADEWNNTQFETEMQLLCTVTHDHICCLLATDARAGEWPAKAVSGMAAAAARCTEFRPRNRANVKDVLPKLMALSRECRV